RGHRLRRLNLSLRQTIRAIAAFAGEPRIVELAQAGILDDAILHTIQRIASIEHGLMNHWIFAGWNNAIRIFIDDEVQRRPLSMHAHLIPRRSAGNDTVEVFGISLSFSKALPAALRTSVVIRKLRRGTIVGIDDRLGMH